MTPVWGWILFGLLPFVPLSDSQVQARQLPHDAYIWQRHWNRNVAVAMRLSADLIRTWRVLAATSDAQGHLQPVAVDWTALSKSPSGLVLVIRIDGQLTHWDSNTLSEEVEGLLQVWQRQQLPITGIEIDHDCATAKLPTYAEFLRQLRGRLETRSVRLSITALPTWMSSSNLKILLQQVDEVVLQVHAVQSPHVGLFDPRQALQWVEAWAHRSLTPFRVALPTYGSRVSWRADGRVLAVESETPLLAGGYGAVELVASPVEVATFFRRLENTPVPHLKGIVWFRLPTVDDRRAWSLETWRAVMTGQPLHAHIEVQVHKSKTPGMQNLLLVNRGAVDAELPQRVGLPESCKLADGINGYALGHGDRGLFLQRVQQGLLPSQRQQLIGWMRCEAQEESIHVQP